MKKRIKVKPIEPILLELSDGTEIEVVLTNEALIHLSDEFGDLNNLIENEISKPYDLAAKILYSGMKVMDVNATLEQAKMLIIGGGMELVLEMFNALSENFGAIDYEELKKNLTPTMNKILANQIKK